MGFRSRAFQVNDSCKEMAKKVRERERGIFAILCLDFFPLFVYIPKFLQP